MTERYDPVAEAKAAGKEIPELEPQRTPPGDRIAEPRHYRLADGFETWDVIEAVVGHNSLSAPVNYHLGEVLRYVTRAGRKKGPDGARKDLQKAQACLARALDLL